MPKDFAAGPNQTESRVYTEPAARRLLARASELESLDGDFTLTDLRAAAEEAGISAAAFESALLEQQRRARAASMRSALDFGDLLQSRVRIWALVALGVASVVAFSKLTDLRSPAPSAGGPSLLHCQAQSQAAEMVRERLQDLTDDPAAFQGKSASLERLKEMLAEHERDFSSCHRS